MTSALYQCQNAGVIIIQCTLEIEVIFKAEIDFDES